MLRLDRVSASYGPIQAIAQVSLEVGAGGIVCLLGANGAGKSTTLNCISGLVRPSEGRIVFDGADVAGLPPNRVVELGIVQVPEGREIVPELSVADNLLLGAWVLRGRGDKGDLDRVYDYFPRLRERAKQLAGTLSGGEQQMLMIGRALMARPRLLLLDEPSLGLSPVLIDQVFDIIRRIHQTGVAVLLVEQNARIALAVSQHGYILENGEVTIQGKAADLGDDPRVRAAYIGG